MDTLFKYKNIDQISWDLNLVCETPQETHFLLLYQCLFFCWKISPLFNYVGLLKWLQYPLGPLRKAWYTGLSNHKMSNNTKQYQ